MDKFYNNPYLFISIGKTCCVKYQIDKYFGSKETLFFDWIQTDIDTVNSILGCWDSNKLQTKKNIEKIINIKYVSQMPPQINSQVDPLLKSKQIVSNRIFLNSLSYFMSIHDIIKYDKANIINFIEKYKRRFYRIVDYIRKNNNIIFIRYEQSINDNGNKKETEYTHFIKIIQNINPNCNFKLVELVDYNKENNHILAVSHKEEGYNLIRNNFISINLYNFRKDKKISHSEYPQNHLDWKSIFKVIINLVS